MRASLASFSATSLVLGLGLVLATSTSALADDHEGGPQVKVSGFVDTSVVVPILAQDGSKKVSLGLDQAEIDIEGIVNKHILVRTDLNVFPSANTPITEDSLVEQAFVQFYVNSSQKGLWFKAGKANAPVGVEAIDPPDMYQFSHGLVFSLLEPSNLTGFWGGWAADSFGFQLWFTNEWDSPTVPGRASVGARGEGSFGDAALGLVVHYQPLATEEGEDGDLMIDLDFKIEAGKFTGFFGGNFGMRGDATRFGVIGKGNLAFSDRESATLRVDYVSFDSGVEGAEAQDAMSLTAAFLFGVGVDGLGGVVEVRADLLADQDGDGEDDTNMYAALELIGMF